MRMIGLALLCAALAGCSKSVPGPNQSADLGEQKARSGSDVAPQALPGVALTYAYLYRLPIDRLTVVQEQHAAACETLGPARCRIVGMHYLVGANRSISASLGLRLAPDLARAFGKKATAIAVSAGGMLVETTIESADAGRVAAVAHAESDKLSTERRSNERQLASGQGGGAERSALQERVATLNDSARAADRAVAEARSQLAETPLSIDYVSGDVQPGFGDGPVLSAIRDGWGNIVSGFATIILIMITLVPWLIALGLILLIWSRLRLLLRRLFGRTDDLF